MKPFFLLLLTVVVMASPALAAGDAKRGKTLYAQCAACHSQDPAKKTLGPHLKGVLGRKAGGLEGYVYSPPMRRSTVVWTAQTLGAYLADPQAVVRGTKMPFSGLATSRDRDDLIAYISMP